MGWATQSRDDDHEVQVNGGQSKDLDGQATTEFIFVDHSDKSGGHDHVVVTDTGNVIHDTTGSA